VTVYLERDGRVCPSVYITLSSLLDVKTKMFKFWGWVGVEFLLVIIVIILLTSIFKRLTLL